MGKSRSKNRDDFWGYPPWIGNLELATRHVVQTTRHVLLQQVVRSSLGHQSAAEMQSPLPALCQIDLRNMNHGDQSKSQMLDVSSNIAASKKDFASSLLRRFAMSRFVHSSCPPAKKNHEPHPENISRYVNPYHLSMEIGARTTMLAPADEVVEDAHVPVITCLMIIPIYDKS